MKHLLRSWVFWAFVVVPPIVGLLLFGVKTNTTLDCPGCLSTCTRTRWVLMFTEMMWIPLSPSAERVMESRIYRALLSGAHEHRWLASGSTGSSIWGLERTPFFDFPNDHVSVLFAPRLPFLLRAYEKDPDFQEFIQGKLRRGEVTREDCRAVLMVSGWPDKADPRVRDLAARRDAWYAEFEPDRWDAPSR